MWDRFHERFEIIRGIDLRNADGKNLRQDRNQVITSIDRPSARAKESLSRGHHGAMDRPRAERDRRHPGRPDRRPQGRLPGAPRHPVTPHGLA
jgi:hypothetical protein